MALVETRKGREGEMDSPDGAGGLAGRDDGRLRTVLERRAEWIEALIVLDGRRRFVVLGFLASLLRGLLPDHPHLLLRVAAGVPHLAGRRTGFSAGSNGCPRPLAVIAVIVPVIVIGAIILGEGRRSLAESFVELAAALPGPGREPTADPRRHPVAGSTARDPRRRRRHFQTDRDRHPARAWPTSMVGAVRGRAVGVRDVRRRDHRRQPGRVHGDRPRQDPCGSAST